MALDMTLLKNSLSCNSSTPIMRFYEWEGTYLSIGYNQKILPSHWENLVCKGKLKIVRRPSGGGAVLHHKNLSYAFIWPSPPKKRRQAYTKISEWLINGFSEAGIDLHFGNQKATSIETNCFGSSTFSDLVDENENKRVGSSQRWIKGNVLQHGEILLDPPKNLWWKVFQEKPPDKAPKEIPRDGLEELLKNAWLSNLPKMSFQQVNLSNEDIQLINTKASEYLIKFD